MNAHNNHFKVQPYLMEDAMLHQEVTKILADSLRTYVKENHQAKLKAAHAHELVAAYFGYKSKNAMLADEEYGPDKVKHAKIIILVSEEFINKRRLQLTDLPSEISSSYELGEAFFTPLFKNQDFYTSDFPPFKSYQKFAQFFIKNYEPYKESIKLFNQTPIDHLIDVNIENSFVEIKVTHCHQNSEGELISFGETSIRLPRIAGKIGFDNPMAHFVSLSGGFRKKFFPKGRQNDV
jgi:hypothetical protein